MQLKFVTKNPEETELISAHIGARLKGGEVIELISDLGGGKTTFMRGLSRGAKSEDVVTSPTFTVSKVYITPTFEIHHFDFYRLPDPGLIAHELEDLVGDPAIVVAVEWAQDVQHILPDNKLSVRISAISDTEREVLIEGSAVIDYLFEGF